MQKLMTIWEQFIETLPLIVIASIGASIQWGKMRHPGGVRGLVLSMATAGFGSLCIGFLASAFPQVPYGITLFACGMIGYSGGSLVDYMLFITQAKVHKMGDKIIEETEHNITEQTISKNIKETE